MTRRKPLLTSLVLLLPFTAWAQVSWTVNNSGATGYWPTVSGDRIAFMADEYMDGIDYSGDGEIGDDAVSIVEVSTATFTPLGPEGYDTSIDGDLIAFYLDEHTAGVNGTAVYDIATDTLIDLGMDGQWPVLSGGIVAVDTVRTGWATFQGMSYYDLDAGTLIDTGEVGHNVSLSGGVIAYEKSEWRVAEDLNGDGDLDDTLLFTYDIATGNVFATGVVGRYPAISGSVIAYSTPESEFGVDKNGDGIVGTWPMIVSTYDLASGEVTYLDGFGFPSIDGTLVAWSQDEGWLGIDDNGDGDTDDEIVMFCDLRDGTVENTGVVGIFTWNQHVDGAVIAFETPELDVDLDLNGDGVVDRNYVMRWMELIGLDPDLSALVDGYADDGCIDNLGTAKALQAMWSQAQAHIDAGRDAAASNVLGAFIDLVEAQDGQHVCSTGAAVLVSSAETIQAGL
jgi:hypothetical protein